MAAWGTMPARWTDLPRRTGGRVRWVWSTYAGCVALLGERLGGLKARGVRRGAQRSAKTEVSVSGQLALVMSEQTVVGAAVWETLRPRPVRRSCWRWRGCWRGWWRGSAMSEHGEGHRGASSSAGGGVCAPVDTGAGGAQRGVRRAPVRAQERAVELGWAAGSVTVVDEDTGRSGSTVEGRVGFKELVAEVGLGHVGLVLALEVSRFARSSADWHQLLDLCALTGTLIADADGVYSPADFNDRLLLGLKGTMSEAELHLIRARLNGGLRNKAERGELRLALPVGLDRDENGLIVLCPDEQVRHAIERVFALWRRVGSARQVVMELVTEGQALPRRTVGQRRIRWARASYGAVHDFLTNPAYAGAFVFGRTRREKRVGEDGRVLISTVEVPVGEWSVCLPEHHPGYVSWEEYLATRERLRANMTRRRGKRCRARGPSVAAGPGALRALRAADADRLYRQGRCATVMRACVAVTSCHRQACQSLGGKRLERAVVALSRRRHTRRGRATAGAIGELEQQHEQRLAGQRLALERAEFEAERAGRQFDACEPENRLVARTLEGKLEQTLAACEHERGKLAAPERARPRPSQTKSERCSRASHVTCPAYGTQPPPAIVIARSCCAR